MESEPMITVAPMPQPPHEVWVRLKLKEAEFEAKGLPEDVKPYAMAFLSMVSNGNSAVLMPNAEVQQRSLVEGSDKPVLPDTSLSEKSTANGLEDHSPANLLTFYLKYGWDATTEKSTLKQHEQLLLISYYLTTYQNAEQLHSDTYRQAYALLAELPVKEPSNFTVCLNTLIDQECMLRKANDSYVITYKGKNAARRLIAGEKAE